MSGPYRCAILVLGMALCIASAGGERHPPERVALVLGGGAARGAAHIGVIETLTQAGVPIDIIVGSSMGAIVGGLYAAGFRVEELAAVFDTVDPASAVDVQLPPRGGLLDNAPLEIILDALLEGRTLDDTLVPFGAIVVDLETGEPQSAPGASLSRALLASSAIPVLFNPVEIDGRYFYDGGFKETVPVSYAHDLGASYVIAVHITREAPFEPHSLQANFARILIDVVSRYGEASVAGADVIIDPGLHDETFMDFGRAARYVEDGRQATLALLPTILADLERRGIPLGSPGDPNVDNPINDGWRQRAERARRLIVMRERPLNLAVDAGLGSTTVIRDPPGDAGAAGARLRFGVDLLHGPLGASAVGASYARSLSGEDDSLQLRASHRPAYELEVFTVVDLDRDLVRGWSIRTGARTFVSHALWLESALRLPEGILDAGIRYRPERVWLDGAVAYGVDGWLRGSLDARTAIALPDPPLQRFAVRLRGRGALASTGTPGREAFLLGPDLVRGIPPATTASYAVLAASIEFDARLAEPLALADVSMVAPHARVFADASLHDRGALVSLGLGLTLEGSLFGFVPFHLDVDVAYGFSTRTLRVSLRNALPYPEPWHPAAVPGAAP